MRFATRRAWLRLSGGIALHASGNEAFLDLKGRYGEPHRYYHTLAHLERVLKEVERAPL
jgi:predicted metal-dependent HD superfamily phosphohydrolase